MNLTLAEGEVKVVEGGHWRRSEGLQPNKESNKTPQKICLGFS